MCARARVRACGRARMRAYMRACGRACACAHTCVCAYPRVYARRRVRMGACAYMRGYGTVSGGGMRLSDVGSCLVIVAWCNCCMCNYMGMGVVAWALWFDGFCGGYGGFDTPRDASVCKGLRGVVPYLTCYTNVYRVQCESRKAESQAETTDLRVLDRLQSVSPEV